MVLYFRLLLSGFLFCSTNKKGFVSPQTFSHRNFQGYRASHKHGGFLKFPSHTKHNFSYFVIPRKYFILYVTKKKKKKKSETPCIFQQGLESDMIVDPPGNPITVSPLKDMNISKKEEFGKNSFKWL